MQISRSVQKKQLFKFSIVFSILLWGTQWCVMHASAQQLYIFEEMQSQLQRQSRGQAVGGRHFFLLLNATEIAKQLRDGKGSDALSSIEKEVSALGLNGEEKLYVETLNCGMPLSSDDKKLFLAALEKIRKQFVWGGYRDGLIDDSEDWDKHLAWYAGDDRPEDEVAIGDERAVVFAVNTKLGRFMIRGANCFIDINADVDEDGGFLDENTKRIIRRALDELEIERNGEVLFEFHKIEGSEDWEKELKKELLEFVKSLGFESVNFGWFWDEVDRTESLGLVGEFAPDFKLLDYATDKEVRFSELTGGPLTILTFWGNT